MILEIINSVNKFFSYLDISLKYLNRAYTLISIAPTLYILRVIVGLYHQKNYIQLSIYSVVFIILVYFIILNIFYYFFDKNKKWDITQTLVKHLPDEVFNIQEEKDFLTSINGEYIDFEKHKDFDRILERHMRKIIKDTLIPLNDLETDNTYLISKHTLYPFYIVEYQDNKNIIKIGSSYNDMDIVAEIPSESEIIPLGLFISGGEFKANNVLLKEPYQLRLVVRKKEEQQESE